LTLRQKGARTEAELAAEKKRVAEAEQRVAEAEQRVAEAEKMRSELETTGAPGSAATKQLKEQLAKAEAIAAQTCRKRSCRLQAEQQELNARLEKAESELLLLRQKATKTDTELAMEKKRLAEAELRVAEAEQRVAEAEQARSDLETTGAAAIAATKQLKEQLAKAEANAAGR
jgi:chromosome segregation ATPase